MENEHHYIENFKKTLRFDGKQYVTKLPFVKNQENLREFWLGKIGIVADIKKAFLLIVIDEDQPNFVRMIWYENVFAQNHTMKILRFAKVTSSPLILNGTVVIHFFTCIYVTNTSKKEFKN